MPKTAISRSSKKAFTKADVKELYLAVEQNNLPKIEAFAFAASGSYSVTRQRSWPSKSYKDTYSPMDLALRKRNVDALRLLAPHADLFGDGNVYSCWFNDAWHNDTFEIAKLFMETIDGFKDDDGHWLRQAARRKSMRLIELVLPCSDPLAKNEDGVTALMYSAEVMHLDGVERLLPISDMKAVDAKGRDALMHAIEGLLDRSGSQSGAYPSYASFKPDEDSLVCFKALVEACGVDRKDSEGKTVMEMILRKSKSVYRSDQWESINPAYLEILRAAGGKVQDEESGQANLLMQAIEAEKHDLFERFLPSANLAYVDEQGRTPLLLAASKGRFQMVFDLAPQSDCNHQDANGKTALMHAVELGHLIAVRFLSKLTDRSLRDSKGRTAAMISAERMAKKDPDLRHALIFIRLFDPGNAKGQGILPSIVGHPELFEAALPFCDPNDKDADGSTPLHRAIELGLEDAFDALLPVSDVKARDGEGLTPLMLALKRREEEMYQALLPSSDTLAADDEGNTALILAVERAGIETVRALIPRSNVRASNAEGFTALMMAAACDELDKVAALLPGSDRIRMLSTRMAITRC